MANISEMYYGSGEPQWLVETPKEAQSHFDRRGCVRQIRTTSAYQSNSGVQARPGRSENLASRGSYHVEQPAVVNVDRQAYVHHAVPPAVPAAHRTVDRQSAYVHHDVPRAVAATHRTVYQPAFTVVNHIPVNVVEFMVPLCCGKCEEKVREELENVRGVYNVVCDQHNQKVTVSSTVDPEQLLKRVKRVKKKSHFWRGNSYLKNVHHLPSHSLDVHHLDMPVYKPEPAHHRSSAGSISGQNQRFNVSPRPSYNSEGTHYLKSKSVAPKAEHPEFYYAGAEHSIHGSSPSRPSWDAPPLYTTGTPYISTPIDSDSLRYGHLPAPYHSPAYNYSEDYALSSTAYY